MSKSAFEKLASLSSRRAGRRTRREEPETIQARETRIQAAERLRSENAILDTDLAEHLSPAETEMAKRFIPGFTGRESLHEKEGSSGDNPYDEYTHIDEGQREKDWNLVQELQDKTSGLVMGGQDTTRAIILEHLLAEQIEQSEWFGEGATTFTTTEFDDRTRGIDLVVSWENAEGEPVHLGIDFTTSISQPTLKKKLSRLRTDARSGSLASIRYFMEEKPDGSQEPKSLHRIPRVVLGLSRTRIVGLAKRLEGSDFSRESFAKDALQYALMQQASAQLETTVLSLTTSVIEKNVRNLPNNESFDRFLDAADALDRLYDKPQKTTTKQLEDAFAHLAESATQIDNDINITGESVRFVKSLRAASKTLVKIRSVMSKKEDMFTQRQKELAKKSPLQSYLSAPAQRAA